MGDIVTITEMVLDKMEKENKAIERELKQEDVGMVDMTFNRSESFPMVLSIVYCISQLILESEENLLMLKNAGRYNNE